MNNKLGLTGVCILFVLATLAACGGGGGGAGGGATSKAWGTAALIETDNAGSALIPLSPQIAIDTNGNALAVWDQSDGTRNNIWSNRFQ